MTPVVQTEEERRAKYAPLTPRPTPRPDPERSAAPAPDLRAAA